MSFTTTCPYCGKRFTIEADPGKVDQIHRWNTKPMEKGFARIMLAALLFLSVLFGIFAIISIYEDVRIAMMFLILMISSLLFLKFKYDIDGVTVCPFCGKRLHIAGAETGKVYASSIPAEFTTLPKQILKVIRKDRGITTLSKIFEQTDASLEKVRKSLLFLEKEELVKQFRMYYGLPDQLGNDERDLLRIAMKNGKITLKQLNRKLRWTPEKSKALLKSLERKGIASYQMHGEDIWYFSRFKTTLEGADSN